MRALRWIVLAVVVLLVAGGAAAWWGPAALDWNAYRSDIAALASTRLGRQVAISGPIALRLLPEPELTASGVSVAAAADGVAVSARELRLRVGLGGLLAGRIEAQELVLRGAQVRLPWPFRPVAVLPAEWFSATEVQVEDGTLQVGNLVFTAIAGRLTTDAWTGSYAASGTLRLSGRPFRVGLHLSRAGSDGSAGLEATLDGQGPAQDIGAALSGQIGADGDFAGRLRLRGPDLSVLMPAPAQSFALEGRLGVTGGVARMEHLSGTLAGAPVEGNLALHLAPSLRLDGTLAASRIDLDAWRAALSSAPGPTLEVALDLSAEAASLAGGTVRGLHVQTDLSATGGSLQVVRAILPGEATLGADGTLSREGLAWRFEGTANWSAPSLRTTLAWLGVDGAHLPDGVLHGAQGSAHLVFQPASLVLTNLDTVLDGAHLTGEAGLALAAPPQVVATLSAERLDLDNWWPAPIPGQIVPALLSPAQPPVLPPWAMALRGDVRLAAGAAYLHGAKLGAVAVHLVSVDGVPRLERLTLDRPDLHLLASAAPTSDGHFAEAKLDVQADSAASVVDAVPLPPGAAEILRRLPGPVSASLQLAGAPDSLVAKLIAQAGDLRLEADPVLEFAHPAPAGPAPAGSGAPPPAASAGSVWHLAGPLTLHHPGARRLAEVLGLPALGTWLGDGSFALVTQVALAPPEGAGGLSLALPTLDLTAGGLRANGALQLADGALSGHLQAETLPLPDWNWSSNDPLPFLGVFAGWSAKLHLGADQLLRGMTPVAGPLAADLDLEAGRLRLDNLALGLSGGHFAGNAGLDASAAPPTLTLEGHLDALAPAQPLFGLPVDLAGGAISGTLKLAATGYSPAALLATSQGEAHLTAEGATLSGLSLAGLAPGAAEAAVRAALEGGETAPARADLALTLARGVAQVTSGHLEGPWGRGELTGMADLPGRAANLHFGLWPAWPDPPQLGLRLTGSLAAPERTLELANLALWRAANAPLPAHPAADHARR